MKKINLVGQQFGRLLVVRETDKIGPHTAYLCRCSCGAEASVRSQSLRKGETTSCGCYRRDSARALRTTHGKFGSPTYRSWRAMLARCSDQAHPQFKDYGGRGISVAPEWKEFKNFIADMGERPDGKSIDRINNDKGYSGGNCRWATRTEQARNKRNQRI